jgi:flagellar assembly factor FliW
MHVLASGKKRLSLLARNQALVYPVIVLPYFLVISYEFKIREQKSSILKTSDTTIGTWKCTTPRGHDS